MSENCGGGQRRTRQPQSFYTTHANRGNDGAGQIGSSGAGARAEVRGSAALAGLGGALSAQSHVRGYGMGGTVGYGGGGSGYYVTNQLVETFEHSGWRSYGSDPSSQHQNGGGGGLVAPWGSHRGRPGQSGGAVMDVCANNANPLAQALSRGDGGGGWGGDVGNQWQGVLAAVDPTRGSMPAAIRGGGHPQPINSNDGRSRDGARRGESEGVARRTTEGRGRVETTRATEGRQGTRSSSTTFARYRTLQIVPCADVGSVLAQHMVRLRSALSNPQQNIG